MCFVRFLRNVILWDNTPTQLVEKSGSQATISDSVIQGGCPAGSSCSSISSGDPLFVTNPSDGGDGWGVGNNDSFGDLHPTAAPPIDAGDTGNCPASDIEEKARVLACDIGAYEATSANTTTVTGYVSGTGSYTFGPTNVTIQVNNVGNPRNGGRQDTTLQTITTVLVNTDHSNATSGIQTGRYWQITPSAGASGYNLDLTLPHNSVPDANDKLCRYTGSGWDCAASSFDAGAQTITRAGVTQLSDWATGNDVGPTAITLQQASATLSQSGLWWIVLLLLLCGVTLIAKAYSMRDRN